MMQVLKFIKKMSWKDWLFLFFLIAGFFLFAAIVVEVLWEKEGDVDLAVFSYLGKFNTAGLTKLMTLFSFMGSHYFLLPAYLILVTWFLVKKQKKTALIIGLIGVTSTIMLFLLKLIFHRARPENSLDGLSPTYSFPSGHTTSSFIFYGLLIYLSWMSQLPKKYKVILSLIFGSIALLVALSRIYLHKHFTSDVLAGFCFGTAWLSISIWSMNRMKQL